MLQLEAFTNWLYDNARPLYNLIRPLETFYLNYFVAKTHVYETGVPRGQYADHCDRLPRVMRQTYVEFVEEELMARADEDEDVFDVLRFHEKQNHCPKAIDTYVYVTQRRDELVELEQKTLDLAMTDIAMYTDEDGRLHTDYNFDGTYADLHTKVENHLYEMDQRYLHRIVDLIPHMWT